MLTSAFIAAPLFFILAEICRLPFCLKLESTGKQYYKPFQISCHYQTILTFSKSFWLTILHTFWEFISNNTDIFRELLANNTAHLSKASIKQYRHFPRVTGNHYYKTLKISNQYQTILTFSESYWQAILHTFQEVIASNICIFREFILHNIDMFRLSWHSCSVWDKPGWLNWFWEFLCERLSSFNLKGF